MIASAANADQIGMGGLAGTMTFVSNRNGTLTFSNAPNGTSTPSFDVNATLTVANVAGNPTFTSDFPVGSTPEIDFTVNLPTTTASLTALAGTPAGTMLPAAFSSGEIIPGAPPAVPEPASLTLFGTALVGLGLFRRRRKQA